MMQIILHAIIDQEEEEDVEKGEEIPLRWIDMEDEEEGEEEEDNGGYPLKEDFFSAAKFFALPESVRPGTENCRECALCKTNYIVGNAGHACGLCYDCIEIKRAQKTLVWEGHDVIWEEREVKVNAMVDLNLNLKRDQFK